MLVLTLFAVYTNVLALRPARLGVCLISHRGVPLGGLHLRPADLPRGDLRRARQRSTLLGRCRRGAPLSQPARHGALSERVPRDTARSHEDRFFTFVVLAPPCRLHH
jgi:hypothetical protein